MRAAVILFLAAAIGLARGQCPDNLICANGTNMPLCLAVSQLCDGTADCPQDGVDEGGIITGISTLGTLDCASVGTSVFDCGNGLSVGLDVMCDGTDDCGNTADENYYFCPQNTFLNFTNTGNLSEIEDIGDDSTHGPFEVTEGNGFIFAGVHRQIYIGSNGYFTFGRGFTSFIPSSFSFTDYIVAPFWADIAVNLGGNVHYEVYTSSDGSQELGIVNQVISQSNDGDPSFNGTWMLVAQWTEVVPFSFGGTVTTTNTFEGILITDGYSSSYAVFVYRCEDINWHGNAVIGYRAFSSILMTSPTSFSENILSLGCNNVRTHPWENLIYRLPKEPYLTFADLGSLSDAVASESNTFAGPIEVSEGNGFVFAGYQQQIYIGSNGYFTFRRGLTDSDPDNFFDTNYIVAPFWANIGAHRGGEIRYQVFTLGSTLLSLVNDVITRSSAGDPSFSGTWMLVAQWTEVPAVTGDPATNNTFAGILITDGNAISYAVFIYRCGGINWDGDAAIGYRATHQQYETNSLSDVLMLGCNNIDTLPFQWENLIYRLPDQSILTFSDPDNLPGVVASQDNTFVGPIVISEGNGFIFAGEHRNIYIGSNGYFTFQQGLTDFDSSNFDQTSYIVAPFWGPVGVQLGGQIRFQVYTSSNGSEELSIVNEVIGLSDNGDPLFNGTWMLIAQWTEVPQFNGDPALTNTFEGILITDGYSSSYAVFIYRCGDINWAGNAAVGYRANRNVVAVNSASFSDAVLTLGCNNTETRPWENLIYRLPKDNFLTFSDPGSLSGVVANENNTFFGPIDVSEGNGFIFSVEHREIYIGSNGYFTFGRGLRDSNPDNFASTDFVVAPFWANIAVNLGGEIRFQVYTSSDGSDELRVVSEVISQSDDGDPSFNGTWMLVAQWTDVPQASGDVATTNTFEGILITDGDSFSYAVFIYRCGNINWAGNAVIGYRATSRQFGINSASQTDDVLMLGCNNRETDPWENFIYRLSPQDNALTFANPGTLSGVVASLDDTSHGPIEVTEGNGFIFAGVHSQIYISSNGYFSFGRPVSTFSPFSFSSTDNVVAPFWADIAVNNGGEIRFEVFNSSNGLAELGLVNQIISQSNDGDPSFNGIWMLVAQWTEVVPFGSTATTNTFEGILITDGDSVSYAVFIYRCEDITWHGSAVVGYRATGSISVANPASFSENVLMLGCNNDDTFPWENLIYRLAGAAIALQSTTDAVSEGDGFVIVRVVLTDNSLAQDITFTITTIDGSATGGVDYVTVSTMFTMPSGSAAGSTMNISIPIVDDNRVEDSEQFTVILSTADPDIIVAQGFENEDITIIDNDFGQFGWSSPSYTFQETDGQVSIFAQIVNNVVLDREFELQYTCGTGRASLSEDYLCSDGNITFPIGSVRSPAVATILTDSIVETDENFFLFLQPSRDPDTFIDSTRDGAEVIIQDTTVVEFMFTLPTYSVSEDVGNAPVAVRLVSGTGTLDRPITLTVTPTSNEATASDDFGDNVVTVVFNTNDTTLPAPIPIVNDEVAESEELFNLRLASSDRAASIPEPNSMVRILEDSNDKAAVPVPIIAGVVGGVGFLIVVVVVVVVAVVLYFTVFKRMGIKSSTAGESGGKPKSDRGAFLNPGYDKFEDNY